MITTFRGTRTPHGPRVSVVVAGDVSVTSTRLGGDLDWGYYGSSCARLAHAILEHVAGAAEAERYHQEFKRRVVAHLPERQWELSAELVTMHLNEIKKEQG